MSQKIVRFKNVSMNPDGVLDLDPQEFSTALSQVNVIDVRRPEEWTGELGHIKEANLVTLETDFQKFVSSRPPTEHDETFVFVCRSGARSSRAAAYAMSLGFKSCYNMAGGMIRWNELKLPVIR